MTALSKSPIYCLQTRRSDDSSDEGSQIVMEVQLSVDLPVSQSQPSCSSSKTERAQEHNAELQEQIVAKKQSGSGCQAEDVPVTLQTEQRVHLRALRIPDKVNKEDEFLSPHPEAPTSFKQLFSRPDRDR